jgi:hypothetical protein
MCRCECISGSLWSAGRRLLSNQTKVFIRQHLQLYDPTLVLTENIKHSTCIMSSNKYLLGRPFSQPGGTVLRHYTLQKQGSPVITPGTPITSMEKSLKFCYDRRLAGQSYLVSSTHVGLTTRFMLLSDSWVLIWGDLSDERTGLPFTVAAGLRQRSHSWVLVPWNSWPYLTVSDSRPPPQPGGPGPRIYITQKQGGPVIPPGTVFAFRYSYDSQGYGGGIRTHLHAVWTRTVTLGQVPPVRSLSWSSRML